MEIRNEKHFTSLKDVSSCTSCAFVDVSISTSVVLYCTKIIWWSYGHSVQLYTHRVMVQISLESFLLIF